LTNHFEKRIKESRSNGGLMEREEWRVIQDFPEYAVSDFGRVKNIEKDHILKPSTSKHGYLRLWLHKESIKKSFHVHTLVAEVFIGKRPYGKTVNHKDGVKINNHAENLEYLTLKENIIHGYRNGLIIQKGENNNRAKLTEEKVRRIKSLYNLGIKNKTLALMFDSPISTVSNICSGYSWKHI